MPTPRILFFGYSEVGYACLSLLLERGDHVVALITHEDNPHEKIWFQTPAVAARERGIPVFTPESVNTPEWRERIAALQPDLILSVYYRHMIGTKILAMPPLGAWNMHGSLLPKYRGRAPINWAVLHGEPRIGMTLHRMVKSADAGEVVDQEGVDLGPRDTAEQAFRKVLPCARTVLARQIDALLEEAGTDKSRLISAQIFITDITKIGDMNRAWDAWMDPNAKPARATVEAKLANPAWKVEITAICAL